jgi:hypothetical protein
METEKRLGRYTEMTTLLSLGGELIVSLFSLFYFALSTMSISCFIIIKKLITKT